MGGNWVILQKSPVRLQEKIVQGESQGKMIDQEFFYYLGPTFDVKKFLHRLLPSKKIMYNLQVREKFKCQKVDQPPGLPPELKT